MSFVYVSPDAEDVSGRVSQRPNDHELSALASMHRDVRTKKHARAILRVNGFSGAEAAIEQFETRVAEIVAAHKQPALRHAEKRLGKRLVAFPAPSGRPAVLLPEGPVMERLNKAKKAAVVREAKLCFRYGAAGGYSFKVRLTGQPDCVNYTVIMDQNRTTYRGSFKGWAAREDHHNICVPADWRTRVLRRGLARLGGLLTLDIHPILGHGNIELFRAVWAEQSMGYDVKVRHGVIARAGRIVFHAATTEDAIRGIKLKVKRYAEDQQDFSQDYALSVEEFIGRYASLGHLPVAYKDAEATGACAYGIRAWCKSVEIDLQLGQVPLSRILEGFRIQPQEEVRATVIHVVRRHRTATVFTSEWAKLLDKQDEPK